MTADLRAAVPALVATVTVAIAGALLPSAAGAATAGSECWGTCEDPPTTTPTARAGSVAVQVTGGGQRSGGSSFTLPARGIWVPPVCYYSRMGTGREYATALHHGLEDSVLRRLPVDERSIELPGWQQHAEDDAGAWWIPVCDDQSRFAAYNAANDPVYLSPGEPAPVGEVAVPPEVLAQVAYDAMDLPTGTIRWNPTVAGSGATVVNVATWVWVEDGPASVAVTASVPGVSATVDATLDHLEVTAPGADSARCAGPGTAWAPDAAPSTACALTFYRSTANQPVKASQTLPTATMTATATWTASWTSNLTPDRTPLPDQEITTTTEVPVAEIQALVTS